MKNRNNNQLRGFSALVLSLFFVLSHAADKIQKPELVFLNWADYMDPTLIQEFSDLHQVHITQVYFESDQNRTEMLLETSGKGFDVVLTVGIDMASYRAENWLEPIDVKQVPHLKQTDERWLHAFDKSPQGYGVPFLWGGLGILYQKDKIKEPIETWMQLFKPDPSFKGRVHMLKGQQDMLGLALKALGYSYNSQSRSQLKEAEQLLLQQKHFVGSYGVPIIDETSGFVTGDYWLGMAFNGDALSLKALNDKLEFVIPKEGTGLWCDYLTVMKSSNNKALAFKFIDFLTQAENAARLVKTLNYASTNTAAKQFLSDKYIKNASIYPSSLILDRSETGAPFLPIKVERLRTNIYQKLIR